MRQRPFLVIICILTLLLMLSGSGLSATPENFGLNWKFAVNVPQAELEGTLSGRIEHLQKKDFRFNGNFVSNRSPLQSGPISVQAKVKLGTGVLVINEFRIHISRLGIKRPDLKLDTPDITISGNGRFHPTSGQAEFRDMTIQAGELPPLKADLSWTPQTRNALLRIKNPLPFFEALAESLFNEFNQWDKQGNFELQLSFTDKATSPELALLLLFNKVATASPDGAILVDGLAGSIRASLPSDIEKATLDISLASGEALYDTFYINLNEHPLKAQLSSSFPDKHGNISTELNVDWTKMCQLTSVGTVHKINSDPRFSGRVTVGSDEISEPFRLLVADPFSFDQLEAAGQLNLEFDIQPDLDKNIIHGKAILDKAKLRAGPATIQGINSQIPFAVSLDKSFKPQEDEKLATPEWGTINFSTLKAGRVELTDFSFPLNVSSNRITFGDIPVIPLEGGTIKFSGLDMENPFTEAFRIHGIVDADDINLLTLSPKSLPVDGTIGGDIEIWLLKDHFYTNGGLYGKVYGGQMSISEIFAENIFNDSRQFGADFHLRHLDLEPLSKALDIGRITGRMDLSLTDLIIAYNQPASFHLRAATTPGSTTDREISLKAVNTLSVIGTGSGLTGAGVGVFSQFFKEFGYAKLGLDCTLDNDIFKIRGLIREDGIEYIIKRPPLFGINVINSNPKNLISFSDMLKRLKRVIGN